MQSLWSDAGAAAFAGDALGLACVLITIAWVK